MDPRRFLIPAVCGLLLSGCALLRPSSPSTMSLAQPPVAFEIAEAVKPAPPLEVSAPEATSLPVGADRARPYEAVAAPRPGLTGRVAIAAANAAARTPSAEDGFVGGVQVFAWSPGRVFEVWTAPLRVTTLSLAPGETLIAKAAGDTVRWQIGETISGAGSARVVHVLLKPLERGLETNLVLTTNRRVYLIDLRSGSADGFNAAVTWDAVSLAPGVPEEVRAEAPVRVPDPVAIPQGNVDARYRIEPQGRRARWTPTAVFNDGLRTFITFDPDLQVDEAPVLFVIAPNGERQLVNYRQAGGLFIVDRVFGQAELRLGDRRPQVVRIRRLTGARS